MLPAFLHPPRSRLLGGAVPVLLAVLAGLLIVTGSPSATADTTEDGLTRHRDRLGVSRWLAAGYRGRGIKIAILDADFAGWKDELGETLPARARGRSFRVDGNLEAGETRHGLRAAQVIHSLAPGADMLFANWEPSSPVRFLEAVRWAQAQGARIISCSVTAAGWGDGEGGGPIHGKLGKLLGKGERANEPLFFCSAGNMARGHWGGAFQNGEERWHAWKPGLIDNGLTPEGKGQVKVNLIHRPGAVYELLLYEKDSKEILARAVSEVEASVPGNWLTFTPKAGRNYRLRLRHVGGRVGTFHLVARGASLEVVTLKNSVCCFPADNAAVLTVGAVDWHGRRASYSAFGPVKPELVAPVPFPCPGKPDGFSGTSAAAPQAAALAALMLEKNPRWTARDLRLALLSATKPTRKRSVETHIIPGRISLPQPH